MGSEVAAAPTDRDRDRLRVGLMSAGLRMWNARAAPDAIPEALEDLVTFCLEELLPYLELSDNWLLEAQKCPEGRLLAEAMRAENRTMVAAVDELSATTGACEAMALVRVLHSFLAAHDHHERLLRAAVLAVRPRGVAGSRSSATT